MARKKATTTEQSLERIRAANDRLRVKVSSDTNDISLKPLSWWRSQWQNLDRQKQFIENFIKIRSKHDEHTLVPLKFNEVQNDIHYNRTGRDVYLKFRQGGVSTYFLALNLCKTIIFSGRNIRFVPHDDQAEKEFWTRLDIMYVNLPPHLQPDTRYYSKVLLQIEDAAKNVTDSKIICLIPRSKREKKSRSLTLTDAHLTEVPFWDGDQEKFFVAMLDATDKGNIAIESTAQGKEKFYFYYQLGKKKGSGWKSHFYEWWWLRENRVNGFRFANINNVWCLLSEHESSLDIWKPNAETTEQRIENNRRLNEVKVSEKEIAVCEKVLAHLQRFNYVGENEKWNCWQVAEYLAWRRKKITDYAGDDKERGLKIFLVENPENDIDCFDSSTLTVVSPHYLKVTCEPIELSPPEERFEEVRTKIENRRFIVSADTSLGVEGSDPAAIEVLDVDTGRQAYSEELLMSPDLLAYRIVEISDWFNYGVIAIERNNTGIATIKKVLELVENARERVFKELTESLKRQVEDGRLTEDEAYDKAEFGIATTTANKALFGLFLEKAIRNEEIGLSSQGWCDQAQTVVWLNTQKTEWGAMAGHHDDRFMALAIANYVRETNYANLIGGMEVLPETGYAR